MCKVGEAILLTSMRLDNIHSSLPPSRSHVYLGLQNHPPGLLMLASEGVYTYIA